ncbi:MAG: M1 family metallopeptidase [Anaerolineae bacterium]
MTAIVFNLATALLLLVAGCAPAADGACLHRDGCPRRAGHLPPESGRDLHRIATAQAAQPTGSIVQSADCPPAAGTVPVRHSVEAALSYATRTAEVAHQISFLNQTNQALSDIGLNVEPNRFPAAFALERVLVNGQPAPSYELAGRRLLVTLGEPLAPGCALSLELTYRVAAPPLGEGAAGLSGYFSYTSRQLNLGHWLPTVAIRRDGAWVSHDAADEGEQTLAAPADWRVDLRVSNAPSALKLAAPGDVVSTGDQSWRITLPAARDFSISLSDHFHTLSRRVNGTSVELFALADRPAAQHALTTAADALALYDDLFGMYPYSRFVVVEGDFPDGMEHSGLVFVGSNWFNSYANDPAGYLTLITAHETAHQWWYALIGSDSAIDPWLDEALATYSEYIFLEEYYPSLRDWWWDYRVNSFVGGDGPYLPTDSPVYAFHSVREYINSVYLRGATVLHALREEMGSDAFFSWIEAYARNNAGRIATPQSLWSLLTPAQLAATEAIRAEYLDNKIPVPDPTSETRGE